MQISQEVRGFAAKQNQKADGDLANEKLGADAAAALEGTKEMSKAHTAKGRELYLSSY